MIDAVLNSATGPAIVHDEADLEGARALLIDGDGRCAVLRADGSLRLLVRGLDAEMAPAFRAADGCPFIRMEGHRVRSNNRVDISARQ